MTGMPLAPSFVSIQLVSPASGDFLDSGEELEIIPDPVSIQLVSPASGDLARATTPKPADLIAFPFNWCPQRVGTVPRRIDMTATQLTRFHSIGVPSEWGLYAGNTRSSVKTCFHSIGVPSEWGRNPSSPGVVHPMGRSVSIQLVSPASGDRLGFSKEWVLTALVSIQLVSPASGDRCASTPGAGLDNAVSIQLVSPASGDRLKVIFPTCRER